MQITITEEDVRETWDWHHEAGRTLSANHCPISIGVIRCNPCVTFVDTGPHWIYAKAGGMKVIDSELPEIASKLVAYFDANYRKSIERLIDALSPLPITFELTEAQNA